MMEAECLENRVREELAKQCAHTMPGASPPGKCLSSPGICPVQWLLRDLTGLLMEFPTQPVQESAPLIRRLLLEQVFVDDNGDSVRDVCCQDQMEHHVAMAVRILEKVRLELISQEAQIGMPACIPWCG